MINKLKYKLIAVFGVLLVCGCASTSNFDNTPIEEAEFHKSYSQLKKDYSDIEMYERTFSSPSKSAPKKDLEELWGEAHTEKKWGEFLFGTGVGLGLVASGYMSFPLFALVYSIYPMPSEEYTWEKGNFLITAHGRRDAYVRYEPRIHNWEWKEGAVLEEKEAALDTQRE